MAIRFKPEPFIAILLLGIISAFSCKTIATGEVVQTPLENILNNFATDESLRSASWGFYAVDVRTGEIIGAYNQHLALMPASTLKMVTTITALSALGADYRFETLLQHSGSIENGILKGDLFVRGSGDPTLGSKTLGDSLSLENLFNFWIHTISRAGINQIEGRVVADGSWFDDHLIPPKWLWEDMGNYYGAGAHALTVNENLYSVFFRPGRREDAPAMVLRTEPFVPGMVLDNQVRTGPRGSGDRVNIFGAPYSNNRWLTGTVPLGVSSFEVKGSLPDPGLFLAATLTNSLITKGIKINNEPTTHQNLANAEIEKERKLLATWYSPTLDIIAARTNFNSVNTYAENLFKTLGKKLAGEGSFQASSKSVTRFWEEKGIDVRGLMIHDGSGLSPFNNVTTEQMALILKAAANDTNLYRPLVKGLPVAARTGNLAGMFANTPSAGVLMAKSGSLGNVRGYAGYTINRSEKLIAFAFIINNFEGTHPEIRRKMEGIMNEITRTK